MEPRGGRVEEQVDVKTTKNKNKHGYIIKVTTKRGGESTNFKLFRFSFLKQGHKLISEKNNSFILHLNVITIHLFSWQTDDTLKGGVTSVDFTRLRGRKGPTCTREPDMSVLKTFVTVTWIIHTKFVCPCGFELSTSSEWITYKNIT